MSSRSDVPFPAAELIRAVQLETAALLDDEKKSKSKVILRNGRLEERSGEDFVYMFSCKSWQAAFENTALLLRPSGSDTPWLRAEASRMPDGVVRVELPDNIGAQVESAEMIENETVGLAVLMDRLERASTRLRNAAPKAADWTIGRGQPRIGRCSDVDRFVHGYRHRRLNIEQRRSVEQALGSDITFVWGPPGTGKTEVVATAVEGCIRQGHRVLFLAPTNVAVDQALERVCELLEHEPGFDSGLIKRAGGASLPSLMSRFGDKVIEERTVHAVSGRLQNDIERTAAQLAAAEADAAVHTEFSHIESLLGRCLQHEQAMEQELRRIATDADRARTAVLAATRKIEGLNSGSAFFADRRAAKLDRLRKDLERHRYDVEGCTQQRASTEAELQRCRASAEAMRARAEFLRGTTALQNSLPRIEEVARSLREHLAQLKAEQRTVAESVRSRCRLVSTTVSKAIHFPGRADSFDVVVIDEAGMVPLPAAWYVAGLATRRLIIAGDFRQLPAVTHGSANRSATATDRAHSREWMDRDVFHAAGLVDVRGSARLDDPRMIALNEQYRMRPQICAVVNAVAYSDAPLLTGRPDTSGVPKSSLLGSSLLLIDTSVHSARPNSRASTRSNTVHEAVVHELIRGLQYDGVLPARKSTDIPVGRRASERVAVIVPYNDQKKQLAASLKYRFGTEYDGVVDTVHRFQGSQRPVVVIDTVAGASASPGYFYEGKGFESATCRLLNVALSRAQDHLVVVANVAFLRENLDTQSPVVHMLDALEQRADRLTAADLVPIRSAADLGTLDEDELARPAFFPADEVPRAVRWDIEHAHRSIDIYCAFLDPVPVRRWSRPLRAAAGREVKVTIFTRPPDPARNKHLLIEELEAAGFSVQIRERMHEKVMIVDDTVLWHGSLNLLAGDGPTDLMMRITDPLSCTRVRHIVTNARMERPARSWPMSAQPRGADRNGNPGLGPGSVHEGRRYLAVPYDDKDKAKSEVKARWDRTLKLWHVDAAVPLDQVRQWLPEPDDGRPPASTDSVGD